MDESATEDDHRRAEAFLAGLESEIRNEERQVRRERDAYLARPLSDRVRSGWTLSPATLRDIPHSPHLRLAADLSHSKYREGDRVRVHTGFLGDADGLDATVARDGGDHLRIRPERAGAAERLLQAAGPLVVDPAHLDLSPFYLAALDACASSRAGREVILPMLLGDLRLQVEGHAYDEGLDEAEARGLNPAQADAFASCVACSHAYYVQGPPGTGKTRVLAEVARALVERGERVWITALTHRAINHAMLAVQHIAPDLPMARIADAQNELPPGIDHYEYLDNSPLLDEPGGYALGATPFLGMTRRLGDWTCDTLLMDEASQVTLPLALMAMLKARRVLLFGDDRQLPPIQVSCPAVECQERSVLSRLPLSDLSTRLDSTYRMHPDLCDWPSRRFYDGALAADPSTRQFPPPLDGLSDRRLLVASRSVEDEVEQVCRAVARIHAEGRFPLESVAVLSPFRAQVRRLRDALRARGFHPRIDTVERMQGQECDIALYALGVAEADQVTALADFLFHPGKFNVAVTRARAGVILFAHPVYWNTRLYGHAGEMQSLVRSYLGEARSLEL